MSIELLISIVAVSIGAAGLLWKVREARKLRVTLIPGSPHFGADHVRISLRIQNEGTETYTIIGAEARFDLQPVKDNVFSADSTRFRDSRVVHPMKLHHNSVRIPFLVIGEEWRRLRNPIPRGQLRIGLMKGKKIRFTHWVPFNSGPDEAKETLVLNTVAVSGRNKGEALVKR